MKTIVLTGGGTAGHIMPNIALLDELKKHFDKIYYIGSDGMEKQIVKKYGIEFYEITAVKLIRKLTPKNLAIPFKLLKSIRQAKQILKQLNPSIIFSKGGYVSLPVAMAGKKLGIPVVSHESDLSMGLANKIIAKYSNVVCTSFAKTAEKNKKFIYTGSPLRKQLFCGSRQKMMTTYPLDENLPTIMFLGGSLGSSALNKCVLECLPNFENKFNILHICGKNMQSLTRKNYVRLQFTDNIEDFYSVADVVVCRSGSNTIFELLALQKPMILVPLPKTQSRGDQIENAIDFEQNGYAKCIFEEHLNYNNLYKAIAETLDNKEKIISKQKSAKMQDANKNIVNLILANI
ncbi:MAG: undecaprenyldiphospho-muramoylpentapeptide beta-N-acetylglucosaminyltransferase [Clostridia bacterium]|nr:undecaprenyldiphospho-muramoylpentapeptide beta-N-acetylglucosaminyltransferase [Clostridia bacterium]